MRTGCANFLFDNKDCGGLVNIFHLVPPGWHFKSERFCSPSPIFCHKGSYTAWVDQGPLSGSSGRATDLSAPPYPHIAARPAGGTAGERCQRVSCTWTPTEQEKEATLLLPAQGRALYRPGSCLSAEVRAAPSTRQTRWTPGGRTCPGSGRCVLLPSPALGPASGGRCQQELGMVRSDASAAGGGAWTLR